MGHPSMPRWRYTVFRPCPYTLSVRYKVSDNFNTAKENEGNFCENVQYCGESGVFLRK